MKHPMKNGLIVLPNHGSSEIGTGLKNKILKDAGIK
jgi:predicted RNA binding protein YcfA (HicA-like mRNA interferase family)